MIQLLQHYILYLVSYCHHKMNVKVSIFTVLLWLVIVIILTWRHFLEVNLTANVFGKFILCVYHIFVLNVCMYVILLTIITMWPMVMDYGDPFTKYSLLESHGLFDTSIVISSGYIFVMSVGNRWSKTQLLYLNVRSYLEN